jgi:hypothetical protein
MRQLVERPIRKVRHQLKLTFGTTFYWFVALNQTLIDLPSAKIAAVAFDRRESLDVVDQPALIRMYGFTGTRGARNLP